MPTGYPKNGINRGWFKKGCKPSEKTKQKIGLFNRGRKHSEETKRRMSLWHSGKKLTEEHKRTMSEVIKGKNHPNWKGGISSINQQIRNSLEYNLWRKAVFARDNFRCI